MRDLFKDLELCEKATPGPWEQMNGTDVFTKLGAVNGDGVKADDNAGWYIADCGVEGFTPVNGEDMELSIAEQRANARFIAEAREGWPHAIRRALEAEAERDELRKIVSSECPIDALDIVNSLRVEKWHMQERIAELEAEIKRLKAQIEEMKDEIAAWKKIALGFDKFREGEE